MSENISKHSQTYPGIKQLPENDKYNCGFLGQFSAAPLFALDVSMERNCRPPLGRRGKNGLPMMAWAG